VRKTKVDAMSADSDSSQVEDAQAPLSVAEFSKRQVAMIERQMLSATDLADLIDLSMTGIRQLSGGSQVEIWLHDPVDELDRHLDAIGVLSGTVRLLEDSYDFVSLYSEEPQWNRTASAVFNETSLFKSESGVEQTLLLPVMDHDLLVGSVHIANPRSSVMMDDDQMTALLDFVAKVPLLINRVVEMDRIRDFVLLDPATNVANRAGLLRDLEREINRARRNKRAPLLVVLKLVGLDNMNNLSQRHIQSQILRGVGSRIAAGLRDTDAVGRISEDSFGVMVVDAVEGSAPMIVARWESELAGQLVDDGAGGMIEINLESKFHRFEQSEFDDMDSSEIATRLLSSLEQSLSAEP
jgi:two-component system cell cycle response regulator